MHTEKYWSSMAKFFARVCESISDVPDAYVPFGLIGSRTAYRHALRLAQDGLARCQTTGAFDASHVIRELEIHASDTRQLLRYCDSVASRITHSRLRAYQDAIRTFKDHM